MSLLGEGAMVVWCDTVPGTEDDHDDWHSHEHMEERLGIPGFLRGRRWIATSGAPRIFVMYEVADFDVLTSPPYLERLNNPTPWSKETMGIIRNITRSLCRVVGSQGIGAGGGLLSIRFSPRPEKAEDLRTWLMEEVLATLPGRKGLIAAHLIEAKKDTNISQTEEQKLRGGDKEADWALLIDAYNISALEEVSRKELSPAQLEEHGALGGQETAIYRLAYSLTDADVSKSA